MIRTARNSPALRCTTSSELFLVSEKPADQNAPSALFLWRLNRQRTAQSKRPRAFSENRTKVTLLDPAQVENAIVTRRLRFFAAVIDGKGRQVSRRIGQEEEIYPASVCPFNP